MSELSTEELRALAELCGYELFNYDQYNDLAFVAKSDKHAFDYWNPAKNANQFEELIFAVASKCGICVRILRGINSCTANKMIEADVWKIRTGDPVIELENLERETYKYEVCKAILEAVEVGK